MDDLVKWLREQIAADLERADELARDPHANLSDDELHQRNMHPAYEYKTTEGQRKSWNEVDDPPDGDGWELNTTSRHPDAWERFEYTEERHWRRPRPGGPYVRQTPAAALELRAQCEAYTGILDLILLVLGADRRNDGLRHQMLRALAWSYRHRPGYRDEWRPQ